MEPQQLREKLTELHDELAKADTLDDNTRMILADLRKDIQDLLDQPEAENAERYGTLTGQLRASLAHFESTHPHLTGAMERAIDALVQMGV